jgi:hypothetical protein
MKKDETGPHVRDAFKNTAAKIKKFESLLATLSSTDDKKKALWRDIYANAVYDRESASVLHTDLFISMQQMPSGANKFAAHTTCGPLLVKYIEKMSKSNDQILKLAELVSKETDKQDVVDSDDLFNEIGGK